METEMILVIMVTNFFATIFGGIIGMLCAHRSIKKKLGGE